MTIPHLPIEPLERWVELNYPDGDNSPAERQERFRGRPTAARIGRLIGFASLTVQGWRESGVPLYSAVAAAIALGTHPLMIWPEWLDVVVEDRRPPINHGEPFGARAHQRRGEEPCEACKAARRAHKAAEKRRARNRRELVEATA